MSSYLVTGANRGLGLELTRQLASLPASKVSKIFATARGDASKLKEIAEVSSGRVVIVKLDVTKDATIRQAAAEVEAKLEGKGLDVLINNAGICQYSFGGTAAMDNLEESFATNVLGVHYVTRAFIPLLQKGTLKKIANISTTLASITLANYAVALPAPAYKISKAAMNALTVQYALEYEKEGFTIFSLSPGWLRTDLGGEQGELTLERNRMDSSQRFILMSGKQRDISTSTMEFLVHGREEPARIISIYPFSLDLGMLTPSGKSVLRLQLRVMTCGDFQ
ncbi:hypothetical protein EYC84_010286 [Monilinia fructicola]|uniref:Uncharacterized protein n=1 Tax=Monilinia fructicola TaxID=38448 RepID=A0A5M9JCA9_MONFR|nr:hypothetical protein EYC84_010286 [Monilinia fructicola]